LALQEIVANLWSFHFPDWIVIPTNGSIRRDGGAVMGRGLARQLLDKYPGFAYILGQHLVEKGNHLSTFYISNYNLTIVTFPVKHRWDWAADIHLIRRSMQELMVAASDLQEGVFIRLPRVGCGNGRLDWAVVKPVLEAIIGGDPRFTIVTEFLPRPVDFTCPHCNSPHSVGRIGPQRYFCRDCNLEFPGRD